MQLAKRFGCVQVQVETDSMEAVTTCNGRTMDLSRIGFIVSDIKEIMSEFHGCTISSVIAMVWLIASPSHVYIVVIP